MRLTLGQSEFSLTSGHRNQVSFDDRSDRGHDAEDLDKGTEKRHT